MRRALLAFVALMALADGCGQGGSAVKVSLTLTESDAGLDASDGATAEVAMARCCALQVADAAASATDNCSVLARNGVGVVESCLSNNSGGTYGLWTCGTGSPQIQCGDNGFTCNLGDPCTLVDVGCPGVVQACSFTPYTPPPG
jgi:hypothetical protein